MMKEALLELTSDIVAAHLTNNSVSADQIPQLITAVFKSLDQLGQPKASVEEERTPAAAVRSSVKADAITCLECGARQKTMKRHLMAQHGLSPAEYRARWKLAPAYPMVAPEYAARRSQMAQSSGLGRKGEPKQKAELAENTSAIPETETPAAPKVKRRPAIKAG